MTFQAHNLIIMIALVVGGLLPVQAQSSSQSGTLHGIVVDAEDGLSMPGAHVVLEGAKQAVIADREGVFVLRNVQAGAYHLSVSYLGYQTLEQEVVVTTEQVVSLELRMQPAVLKGGEIVVLGSRLKGQAKALSQQQFSQNVTNVVAADQIGRFPDGNAGDALKRIPGLVVQNDMGEARFGLIRGTPSRFNAIMINGERMPSSEGSRRDLSLDLIPADLLQAIEVNKSLTPDMDADAIGGSVNLVTRVAPNETRFSATVGSGYNMLAEKPTGMASFVYGMRAVEGKMGLIVSGSYFNHRLGSDNVEFEWDTDEGRTFLADHQIRKYDVQRIRYGTTAAFDYTLTPQSTLFLRTSYNLRDDFENRYRVRYRLDKGDNKGLPDANGLVSGARVERQLKGGSPGRNRQARLERSITASTNLSGKHNVGQDLRIDWSTSWAYARENRPDEYYVNFYLDDVTLNPSTTDLDFINVQFGEQEEIGSYELQEFEVEHRFNEERDVNGRLDVVWMLNHEKARRSELKGGFRFRDKSKMRKNDFDVFEATEVLMLTQFELRDYSDDRYLAGDYDLGSFPSPADLSRFEDRYPVEGTDLPENYAGANYEAREQITAGYAMLSQQFGVALSLIAGVRLENTYLDYTGNELQFNEDGDLDQIIARSDNDRYLNVLPGLNARFMANDNTVFRFAATRSLARPNYYDLVPYRVVDIEEGELAQGNPGLKPTVATNLDLSIERYFSSVGLFSSGVFYKQIDDFTYLFTLEDYTDPLSGSAFDEYVQPRNGNGASLLGVEVALQRQLTFLPGLFRRFGIYGNYTFTTSSVEPIPNRVEAVPSLPGSSGHSFNASLAYEWRQFAARVSVNYHSSHINEVGETPLKDVYYQAATYLDANASYVVKSGLRIFLEANNLTNQPLRFYEGVRSRNIQTEYYNARFQLGLKYDF